MVVFYYLTNTFLDDQAINVNQHLRLNYINARH